MTAENLAWFAVCMRFVIAYGCERSIEDGVRLRESDALFRAIRGRLLFIPLCMVWPAARPHSPDAPPLYATAPRDSKRRPPCCGAVHWRSCSTRPRPGAGSQPRAARPDAGQGAETRHDQLL